MPTISSKRYLIIGAGGVGGSIGAFLSLSGANVTFLAHREHLRQIQANGLKLKSDLLGEHTIPVRAIETNAYTETADVIFVCVKSYSLDSIAEAVNKASAPHTIVIPILNGYGNGDALARLVPSATVLDGCIYIVGFRSAPGQITQMGHIFRLVFGPRNGQQVSKDLLETIAQDLQIASITAEVSSDINRDTFVKWAFISAMACTGAYHNVPMGAIQTKDSEARATFIALSKESAAIAKQCNVHYPTDPIDYNLSIIDALDPASTASMQKDLESNHQSEIQSLLFDLIDLGKAHGVDLPTYERIAQKFTHLQQKFTH